jgi:hypothetical protein
VSDSILLKPGMLTDEEMAVMKRHPDIVYDILTPVPYLLEALDILYRITKRGTAAVIRMGGVGTIFPCRRAYSRSSM